MTWTQTRDVQDAYPATTATAEVVPLSAIPVAWDNAWVDLARHASEPNPFAESWFLRPAIRHFADNAFGKMIGVFERTELIGLLPITTVHHYGRLPINHVENWLHYHCFYGAPLIRRGREARFWDAALNTLDMAQWAPNFLHLVGLDPNCAAFQSLHDARRTDVVHRSERAMLQTDLNAESYLLLNLRAKKRKEFRRLRSRLEALGVVEFSVLPRKASIAEWTKDFLALEGSGWKGREGSALRSSPATAAFFAEIVSGAHAAGKLEMLKLTVDGKPIAMLVNFLTPPGSFAFKIAFDEEYARFSPGVLIKIENLKILDRPEISWSDSCAAEDHPMINSLWAERRAIVRVTVPLTGARRRTVFRGARIVESIAARVRART